MAKRMREDYDDENGDQSLDEPIEIDDCIVHNVLGTAWGATAAAATEAAQAQATQVMNALVVKCTNPKCPTPKKDNSIGKPRDNMLVIPITPIFSPKITVPLIIKFGFVCDYEVIYQCT
jgi:hypothetical protein